MQLRELLADEDAVSPVIGVILMVAITVILAAVIGTFVLGLGDQVSNTAPQASFTFDYTQGGTAPSTNNCGTFGGNTGDYLQVTHDGGDAITPEQLTVGDNDGDGSYTFSTCGISSEVSAGDTVIAEQVEPGDTIRITWEASGGGDTATLGKWTGPDA